MRISEIALKKLIKSRNMTIRSFGEKLGMTRQGAYHLLSRRQVREEMIDKISKVLSVDRKEFLVTENPLFFGIYNSRKNLVCMTYIKSLGLYPNVEFSTRMK